MQLRDEIAAKGRRQSIQSISNYLQQANKPGNHKLTPEHRLLLNDFLRHVFGEGAPKKEEGKKPEGKAADGGGGGVKPQEVTKKTLTELFDLKLGDLVNFFPELGDKQVQFCKVEEMVRAKYNGGQYGDIIEGQAVPNLDNIKELITILESLDKAKTMVVQLQHQAGSDFVP